MKCRRGSTPSSRSCSTSTSRSTSSLVRRRLARTSHLVFVPERSISSVAILARNDWSLWHRAIAVDATSSPCCFVPGILNHLNSKPLRLELAHATRAVSAWPHCTALHCTQPRAALHTARRSTRSLRAKCTEKRVQRLRMPARARPAVAQQPTFSQRSIHTLSRPRGSRRSFRLGWRARARRSSRHHPGLYRHDAQAQRSVPLRQPPARPVQPLSRPGLCSAHS